MADNSMEQQLYGPILSLKTSGLEKFDEKTFVPCKGNILVVVPPPMTRTDGGIHLPDTAQRDQSIGRVASIPSDPHCPVEVGDWVIFRSGAFTPVRFGERTDLYLLQYCDGPESDILGFVEKHNIPADFC